MRKATEREDENLKAVTCSVTNLKDQSKAYKLNHKVNDECSIFFSKLEAEKCVREDE